MEKSVESRLSAIAKALDVEIRFTTSEDGKLILVFSPDSVTSKFYALLVFCGFNVESISPSYNRVHADIAYWSKVFDEKPPEVDKPTAPDTQDQQPQEEKKEG